MNSNLIWKSIGTTTGIAEITLPDNWTELKILSCKKDDWNNVYDKRVYREDVYDNTDQRYFHTGYYGSNNINAVASWSIASTTGKLAQMVINGTNQGYEATTYWYYR